MKDKAMDKATEMQKKVKAEVSKKLSGEGKSPKSPYAKADSKATKARV